MIIFDNMQGSIFFNPISNMRKHTAEIEEILEEYYPIGSFNILAVPDNAPYEIPRMIGTSPNQHSNIQISSSSANITVNFDENFKKDVSECYRYMNLRMQTLEKCIRGISDGVLFMGLVAQYVDSSVENPCKFIREKFLNVKTKESIFDMLGKVTFIKNDNYYVNIALNNLRHTNGSQALGINLDINDRYRLNFKKGTNSLDNTWDDIISMHLDFVQNKMNNLIQKGEISL